MANKMNGDEDLRDSLLTTLTRSEPLMRAPDGFTGDVMNRIGKLPVRKVRPFVAPWWLKWGIPGVAVACLAGMMATGSWEPVTSDTGFSMTEKLSGTINSWLLANKPAISMPDINIPGNVVLVVGGLTVLIWSFWFLARFLNKHMKHL